jgi:hypothetical protein
MGIGIISENVSTKVSAAVDAVASSTSTLYTCAANSYAIINATLSASSGSATLSIAGNIYMTTGVYNDQTLVLYVGPNQAVSCTVSGSASVRINGVEFINSP